MKIFKDKVQELCLIITFYEIIQIYSLKLPTKVLFKVMVWRYI
jgi:hypothetical protein